MSDTQNPPLPDGGPSDGEDEHLMDHASGSREEPPAAGPDGAIGLANELSPDAAPDAGPDGVRADPSPADPDALVDGQRVGGQDLG